MRFANPLIIVADINKSKNYYHDVLDLDVILDFGANVTLTGGICLQTKESWIKFIGRQKNEICFGGNDAELYFEEDDFDGFIAKLSKMENIKYVHDVIEHDWGQRAVRFYDPDRHIIEVGENMAVVTRRFLKSGLSVEKTAERMDVPLEYVRSCIK